MPRAEQIDRACGFSQRLDPATLDRRSFRAPAFRLVRTKRSLDPTVGPQARGDRRGAVALGEGEPSEIDEITRVEYLDTPFDASTTALTKLWSQSQRTPRRRSATRLQRRLGRLQRRPALRPRSCRETRPTA
jgi:hypothetical protein